MKKLKISLLFLLAVVVFLMGNKPQDEYFKLSKNFEIFTNLIKELSTTYVEKIDPEVTIRTGINAIVASLDPYTNFIDEQEAAHYQTLITGAYGGIGAIIGHHNERHCIVMLYKNFPAYRGELHIGDEILKINREDVRKKSLTYVSDLLKGEPGTKIRLFIKRYGVFKPIVFSLVREEITLKPVPYFGMAADNVAYIKLTNFTKNTAHEVKKALQSLKAQGAKKLIFDLRGNMGGILEEAVEVANLFIKAGLTVVETKGRMKSSHKIYKTNQMAYDSQMPLIVLIDGTSASAAEIVAGVMQDYDRGVLIGEKTFGKGLVQTTRPLGYDTQLKLTTAKYYIPSGRSIQALDYSQKEANKGMSDTPNIAFKTSNGRVVYEGHGIDPDVKNEKMNISPITLSLMDKHLLFDYATVFCSRNKKINHVRDFEISAQQYQDFTTWLVDKDYDYTTPVEKGMEVLIEQLKNEGYDNDNTIKEQMVLLKNKIKHNKKQDLQKYKKQIKFILKEEIVGQYYLQEGMIAASLNDDLSIQAALQLFKNRQQYNTLLKP